MKRRKLIQYLSVLSLLPAMARNAWAHEEDVDALDLDNDEWRKRLSEEQFYILRQDGTESPWSSALNDENRAGTYHCSACDLSLFEAEKKYDSGTGWPSFWAPIAGHLATKLDFKLLWPRTEYHCARCEGHQGHIFDDGPQPTGKRWCNNGIALKFVPEAGNREG